MGKLSRDKEWRSLDWLPDYAVSEDGDVMRVTDGVTRKRGFMPAGNFHDGYRRFKLTIAGKKTTVLAHRLVCEAFHGPAPDEKHQVAHGDGDRANNHYTNLRWATCQENLDDRKTHGTETRGERNGRARLSAAQVAEIRRSYTGKYGDIARLAREYGLSHSAMRSICKGDHW